MKLPRYLVLIVLASVLAVFPGVMISQVVITEGASIGLTPLQFVQTYMVGTGITVSNALYNGSALPLDSPDRVPQKSRDQIGSFTNNGAAQAELGIGGGVILSTGFTGKAAAGNNPNDDMWGITPGESDPDLGILAGGSNIHDKSILEFDFIPLTDVVTFRYVFCSIEFDGFCGSINDAFGLFLSGPGITGGLGFQNDAVNIALLPNSTNYVNIANICAADQGNIGFGIYSWWNVKKDYYSYNRLTYVFTASYAVQCNQTYHMKFAIGDASDGVLDSGVFLEQNSFSSNNISCVPTYSNPLTVPLLIEGQTNASLIYTVPQTHTTDLIIDIAIKPTGTATQADVLPNPFPIHAIIPAGQLQSTPIIVTPVSDAIPEPVEHLIIDGSTVTCGITTTVTTDLTIKDYVPMSIQMNNFLLCDGSSATLTPNITGGQPILPEIIYNYLWSTSDTTSSIVVSPPAGLHSYSVTVTDACGLSASKTISVDVGTTPGQAGGITGESIICTPVTGLVYTIPAIAGADSYIWTLPPGNTITSGSGTNSITVDFATTTASGLITVKGHSNICGDGTTADLNLIINPAAPAAGPITGPDQVCQGPSVVTYFIEPLSFVVGYEWILPPGVTLLSGGNTHQITCIFTTSAVSGIISVRGSNSECGFGPPAVKPVLVNPIPVPAGVITSISGNVICTPQTGVVFETSPILHAVSYNWTYSGFTGTMTNNGNQVLIDFPVTSTSGNLYVSGVNNCGSGPVSPILPLVVNPKPNVEFLAWQEVKTTKNGRPIRLLGGRPSGAGGIYSGPGVQEPSQGVYVFNPADNGVTGGGTANGIAHTVTYQYTNAYNCVDAKTLVFTVFGSNANDPCPGTIKDVRDDKTYQVFTAGNGANARCWMSENLDYGDYTDHATPQTDNGIPEKYCRNNQQSECTSAGGYYQWDEIMHYQQSTAFQDFCLPGWHVATSAEWQMLIDFSLGNGLGGNVLKDLFSPTGFHGNLDGVYYLNKSWSHLNGSGQGTLFWTTDLKADGTALARGLNLVNSSVSSYSSSRANAFPLRCVRN